MTTTLLEPPTRLWKCPSCTTIDQTKKAEPHTQMHPCAGLGGLVAPLVEVAQFDSKVDARHLLLEREDYIGDSGADRYMAIDTQRGDGSNDRTVLAPFATGFGDVPRPGLGRAQKDISITPDVASSQGGARFRHTFQDTKLARMARTARRLDAFMAWSTSNMNAYYVYAMGTNGVKPSTDSFKVALFGSGVTPAQSTTQALTEYAGASSTWSTGNESSGTGYTAGGVAISSPTWTQVSNVVTFTSAGTPQWTGASFTAYGCLPYDTTASNQAISWNYFGGSQVVTSGTFTITWNASGICAITC